MKIEGEYTIPSDINTVWEALNDPEVLAAAIPGCESLEKDGDNAFKAIVTTRIGPITANFTGAVELQDLNPPYGYTLVGSGNAGGMGGAKGSAKVTLEEIEDGTKLSYDVDAQVVGKIAQLGGRLIESTASVLAGAFFKKLISIINKDQGLIEETTGGPNKILIFGIVAVVIIAAAYFLMS